MEKPSHLIRHVPHNPDNYITFAFTNSLFMLNGIPYHLVPIIENSMVQLFLYEINLQTDTIKLVFKIRDYTIPLQGLKEKVVPFIGSNTIHDHNHICKI